MSSPHDFKKVEALQHAFESVGFDTSKPALVGYVVDGMIQLLSGTHRHMAALRCDVMLPVTLWLRSDVEEMWGTELWSRVIEDMPVDELQSVFISDGPSRSPHLAVRLDY